LAPPTTPSYVENAEGYGLTANAVAWFWEKYLDDPSQVRHPHASPLHAPDLRGLPPALVITAEYDPLRDEGERYGERLREASVPVTISRHDGVVHGFFFFSGLVGRTDAALKEACTWLRGAFAGRA
jgi:acetyl esterase